MARAILPRLQKTHRGFLFFNSISEYESATAYASDILSTPPIQLCRAILQHDYDISRVCTAKYGKLSYAFKFTFTGVVLIVIVLLLKP